MANRTRGEVTVVLGGRAHAMRPTFAALAEMEDLTGRSLQHLGLEVLHGAVRARDIATVLHCGIKAAEGDAAPTVNEIGEAMLDDGFAAVQQPMIDLLSSVLSFYGDGQKKTVDAAPKTS